MEEDSSDGEIQGKQQGRILVRSGWRCSRGRCSTCMAAASWDWGCCGEEDDEEMAGGHSRGPFQLEQWPPRQQQERLCGSGC